MEVKKILSLGISMLTPLVTKKTAAVSTGISLLALVSYLAAFGLNVVGPGRLKTCTATYPTAGSNVVQFRWRLEILVPAHDIPASAAALSGATTSLQVLLPDGLQEFVRAQVAGIDAQGRTGTYSEWSVPGAFSGLTDSVATIDPPSQPTVPP